MPPGWFAGPAGFEPGINEVAAPAWARAPEPENWVTHDLGLDIGEVAEGYHLVARSISLSAANLLFTFAFDPERAEGARVWLNMAYLADVPVSGDYIGAGDEVQYERPPAKARFAWFDFFRPDYEWYGHYDRHGQPDADGRRNRVARLTFDLRTAETRVER